MPPLPPGARERAPEALDRMKKQYGERYWFLDFETPFQLLVAVVLSAQCTDAMVNKVTPELFAKYGTPGTLAAAPREDVERIIYRTGFYRNKAKSIQGAAQHLLAHHGGEVPTSMAELLEIPGVARKTANVVMELVGERSGGVGDVPQNIDDKAWFASRAGVGDVPQNIDDKAWFASHAGVCVDTHVGRVARRLALTRGKDPVKVEQDLMRVYAQEEWGVLPFYFIMHGREVCYAQKPACAECFLQDICPKVGVVAKSAQVAKGAKAARRRR